MSRRRKKNRKPGKRAPKSPEQKPRTSPPRAGLPQEVPQHMFDELVARLDDLTNQWVKKRPDGINPQSYLDKVAGSIVKAYRHGVRAQSLYDSMVELEKKLTLPGRIEVAGVDEQEPSDA